MTKIFKISFLILLVVIVSSYYGESFVLADNNPIVNSENGSDNNFESGTIERNQNELYEVGDYSTPLTERVFGKDQRTVVNNILQRPYKQTVLLNMTFSNNRVYKGTGTMIGKDIVLTAAHNVYSKDDKGWAKKIDVYAGVNGQTYTIGKAFSHKFFVSKTWINNAPTKEDIAIIKLNSNLGNKTGYLTLNAHISKGENIEISGFPGDKSDNRQYKGKGKLESFDENEMYYTVDTFSGQSGSAIRDSKNNIIGVHAYGRYNHNSGVRINDLKLDYINYWIGKYRSHPYNKKVKVIKSKYIYWKNIEITKKGDNKLIKKDKAYTAKLYYNIPNGYKYYSLYDEKNRWMGYFNSNDIKVVK
ncbi:trypsin-like serine peptidase [Staphylococcus aureus]|uniref:trypsin-like serine peptidase n=1 Tax=Staphylococcus aureus TaxID=1280 RepID=UPI000D747613|nr:trypsin-like serine protease [Staphylococcus aureus]AWR22549.1 hypothetical protein B9Y37_00995 [Staphylococcus aureus]